MQTKLVSPEFAHQIEACEVDAWIDMYAAIPTNFARQFQLELIQHPPIALTRSPIIPFVHFNCAMNLGMTSAATEAQLDDVLAAYQEVGMRQFAVFHIPHSQPTQLPQWFAERGLVHLGGWDRIYRDNHPVGALPVDLGRDFQVEKVTANTATEWAAYIDSQYGLPTSPWLLTFVGRPNWHHYMLRQQHKICAVRSMYMHPNGMAWFGIDAPVPGIMGPTYDLDVQLCHAMVRDGLTMGVQHFITDIEAPHPNFDTPAYRHFAALGFQRLYFRSHYGFG